MSTEKAQTRGQLLDDYTFALTKYFTTGREAHLERAYAVGRTCLTIQGMGIEDMLEFHQMAMGDALRADLALIDPATRSDRAARFLAESLAPYEMVHRAFREQAQQRNTELEALNRLFQRHLRERFQTLEKYREVVERLRNLAQEFTGILDFAQTADVPDLRGQQGSDATLRDAGQPQQ